MVPILRSEPISRDVYIALFAGRPERVELREPSVGTRYGVELADGGTPPFEVDGRNDDGTATRKRVSVNWRNKPSRTLDLADLADALPPGPRTRVPLHLEQRAFVQEFLAGRAEQDGSTDLPDSDDDEALRLRGDRVIDTTHLRERKAQADAIAVP